MYLHVCASSRDTRAFPARVKFSSNRCVGCVRTTRFSRARLRVLEAESLRASCSRRTFGRRSRATERCKATTRHRKGWLGKPPCMRGERRVPVSLASARRICNGRHRAGHLADTPRGEEETTRCGGACESPATTRLAACQKFT